MRRAPSPYSALVTDIHSVEDLQPKRRPRLEVIQSLGSKYLPYIEEDEVVNAYDQDGNPL